MTKQRRRVEFLNYVTHVGMFYQPRVPTASTFETRTVYHDSIGYYVRMYGRRREATKFAGKFRALGTTEVR